MTLAVQSEGGDRKVKDRHILEPHRGMLGIADLFVVVEMHLRGLQIPVGPPGLAGRVGGAGQVELVFALKIDPLCLAAPFRWARHLFGLRRGQPVTFRDVQHHRHATDHRITGRRLGPDHPLPCVILARHFPDDVVIGALGETDLLGDLHAQMWCVYFGALLQHPDVAGGINFIFQRPIDYFIGEDQGAGFAQFDITFRLGHLIYPPVNPVGDDKQRIILVFVPPGRLRKRAIGQGWRLLFSQDIELALDAQLIRRLVGSQLQYCVGLSSRG